MTTTLDLLGGGWARIEARGSGEDLPTAPHQPEPYEQGGNLQTTATEITPAHHFWFAVRVAEDARADAEWRTWQESDYEAAAVLYYTRIRQATEALNTAIDAEPQWANHAETRKLVANLVVVERIAKAYFNGMKDYNKRQIAHVQRDAQTPLENYLERVKSTVKEAADWLAERAKEVAEVAAPVGIGAGAVLAGAALLLLAFKR